MRVDGQAMEIDGRRATVSFDEDSGKIRGEFIGLSGGADFYAETIETLAAEGRVSLGVYLDICREKGVKPYLADGLQSPDDQVE
jgi:predicted HicB family RNase H-like nuclease